MGADVSRVRFDALRDHSGVLMQQGRLLLDADWNELVDIVERRLRAGAADLGSTGPTAGIAGVAVVPRTTPDGFALTTSGGALTIGRGRMYVDGMVAENHGTADGAFDPLLSEATRNLATPYAAQPYWPTPAALPTTGTHLAYLDVWKREVTPVEAPDLVEPAVGVDTTTRTQTVWQVRVHAPDTPGITCATKDADIPGWSEVIAPSAGRLSTGTVTVTASEDPCSLPPSGNYRGLENQTYRVEIHKPGPAGTATFTWSRDNGSVEMAITEVISSGRLRPSTLGPDKTLNLSDNAWVEITDDRRELNQLPGELRKIVVHPEDNTIAFAPPLPADMPTTTSDAVARHLRVRRWDQKGQVKTAAGTTVVDLDAAAATGDIPVPAAATAIVLENGITVMLEAPGGRFRTGDHWIFVARTTTTSVEQLVKAPPRGIHHHYARLGVLNGPTPSSDCRTMWPPESEDSGCGDCTVCVTPESHASGVLTIQAAVDLVRPTGGTVCLAVGIYHLDKGPVTLEGCTSVRLHGQGPRTIVLASNGGFEITRSAFVTLEDLTLIAGSRSGGIVLTTTAEVTLRRLVVLLTADSDFPTPAIQLHGVAVRTHLLENDMIAPVCIGGSGEKGGTLTAALEVTGNVLVGLIAGVQLAGATAHLLDNVVRANTVLRCGEVGLQLLGVMPPTASCEVADNYVAAQGVGIDVANSGYAVRDNVVVGERLDSQGPGAGISVEAGTLADLRGATTISGNSVRQAGREAIAVRAGVTVLTLDRNVVQGGRSGIVMVDKARADQVHATGNVVRGIGGIGDEKDDSIVGIQVLGAEHALVDANTVVGVGTNDPGRDAAGVRVLGCQESRVHGNAVEDIGSTQSETPTAGIQVTGIGTRASVEGNDVRRLPAAEKDGPLSAFTGIQVGSPPGQGFGRPKGFATIPGGLLGKGGFFPLFDLDYRATITGNATTGGGGRRPWRWSSTVATWCWRTTTPSSTSRPTGPPSRCSPAPPRSTPTGPRPGSRRSCSASPRTGSRCSATSPRPGSTRAEGSTPGGHR